MADVPGDEGEMATLALLSVFGFGGGVVKKWNGSEGNTMESDCSRDCSRNCW
ncbi:hypothetical protein A2U01_0034811, partial [Trifolium medium]|nr:hypothetical protein [Trifolium medium]